MKEKRQSFTSVLLGLVLSLALYGAYFFNLVRKELQVLVERQEALESLKVLTVPGTAFLNDLGGPFVLKSALFYLVLLGMVLAVLQLFSLCLKKPWQRGVFFALILAVLAFLTREDRVALSFPFVTALSFGAFFFITQGVTLRTSWRDVVTVLLLGVAISGAMFLAEKDNFFIKTRDRVFFDSPLGHHVVSYYYTYSPLAAAVISPARGVYEGLVFQEGFEDPFLHMGQGLVLSGNPKIQRAADFVVERQSRRIEVVNRYGDRATIPNGNERSIIEGVSSLFSMPGFKTLNTLSLYVFPAGLLLLPFFFLRMITERRGPFLALSLFIGLGLLLFIGAMHLVGAEPPESTVGNDSSDLGASLGLAYDLYEKRGVPEDLVPAVQAFSRSESTALRYWGAKLLGLLPRQRDPVTQLNRLLQDPSPNVRYAAGLSLYELLGKDSFQHLLPRLIQDPNWYVKCMLFSAFLRSGTIPHRR